jgi:hypothetical protein
MNVYVLTTTDAYATFCAPLDKIRWPAFWSSRENACHMVGMHDDLVSKDKPCLLYFPNRAWSVWYTCWELALENSKIGVRAPRVLKQVISVECTSDYGVHFRMFPIQNNEQKDDLLDCLPYT